MVSLKKSARIIILPCIIFSMPSTLASYRRHLREARHSSGRWLVLSCTLLRMHVGCITVITTEQQIVAAEVVVVVSFVSVSYLLRQRSRALPASSLGISPPLTKYLCTRLFVEWEGVGSSGRTCNITEMCFGRGARSLRQGLFRSTWTEKTPMMQGIFRKYFVRRSSRKRNSHNSPQNSPKDFPPKNQMLTEGRLCGCSEWWDA